jgi:hypothetical protein
VDPDLAFNMNADMDPDLDKIQYRVIPYQISHFFAKLEVTISDFHEILCAC